MRATPADKLAPRLASALRVMAPEIPLSLHVLLRADLPVDALGNIAEELGQWTISEAPPRVRKHQRSLSCVARVDQVLGIAAHPDVFWLDLAHEDALETLLD